MRQSQNKNYFNKPISLAIKDKRRFLKGYDCVWHQAWKVQYFRSLQYLNFILPLHYMQRVGHLTSETAHNLRLFFDTWSILQLIVAAQSTLGYELAQYECDSAVCRLCTVFYLIMCVFYFVFCLFLSTALSQIPINHTNMEIKYCSGM